MHLHRSRIGVALMGAVAIVGWCSMATPTLAADRDLDGGAPALTAIGAVDEADAVTAKRAGGSQTPTFTRSPQGLASPGAVSLNGDSEGGKRIRTRGGRRGHLQCG